VSRTSNSRTGSGNSTRFYHLSAQAYLVASFPGLLTGCLETSGARNALHSEVALAIVAPAPSDAAFVRRHTHLSRAPSNAAASSSSIAYSDAYWNAIAELNIPASRGAAQTGPEIRFADAIALLAAGDTEKAENAFREMSSQTVDLNVAAASQIMLSKTLIYEHRWAALRDLSTSSTFGLSDRRNSSGTEQWGRAFGDLSPQITTFPEHRVALPLGVSLVGTPTIRVLVNGKEFRFWLDTGSSITVLSSEVAEDAGVSPLGDDTLTIATFDGMAAARPAVVERMEIGPIVLANTAAIVMDAQLMRVKSTADGVPLSGLRVDGIIGWDTIRQFDMSLDYQGATITIQRPQNLGTMGTPAQNLTWMGKPFIEVRTAAGTALHFTLDTGSQGSFINSSILRSLNVTARNSDTRAYGLARTGGQATQVVSAVKLGIGGLSLTLKGLIVFTSPSPGLVNCDGILGSDIAAFGKIRIDATNGLFSIG
jgi:clan AA aspartic protease (TIGR02281 family)